MLTTMFKLIYQSMFFMGVYFTIKLIYEYFSRKGSDGKKGKDWFHKVIFFPDKGICSAKDHIPAATAAASEKIAETNEPDVFEDVSLPPSFRISLNKSTSMVYLLKFIQSAKKNLDLCLLIFTLTELQNAVIEAKKRGVVLRVIIDKTMSDCEGSCLPALQKENIPVLRGPPGMMVHHKFALADSTEEIGGMVATGSINWTWGAITSNYENMIITNNPDIVLPFKNEFDKLWSDFSK